MLHGVLTPDSHGCRYSFDARAGGRLAWSVSGPAVHVVLTSPDGNADGPGLSPVVVLTLTGIYVLGVSPDTMAEGSYGPFELRMQLYHLE